MAYVVVVFAIINTLALLVAAGVFWILSQDIPVIVETAVQDEIRKQDDRIEKRAERARGPAEDSVPTALDGNTEARVVAGRPTRRG